MENNVFASFDNGKLTVPGQTVSFRDIPWSKHPTFAGVELKHIVTSRETGGAYSFHLVRIAPDKAILDHIHDPQLETHEVIAGSGVCVNDGQEIAYAPGTISIMPPKVHHEVRAGADGLYLFAKFMPALC